MLGVKAAPGLQLLLGALQGWKTRIPPLPLSSVSVLVSIPPPALSIPPALLWVQKQPLQRGKPWHGDGVHPNSWGLSVGFGCGMGMDITGPKYAARLRVGSVGSNTSV